MNIEELEKVLQKKMDEIYELRQIISRKKGDVPPSVEVDYEKYITK